MSSDLSGLSLFLSWDCVVVMLWGGGEVGCGGARMGGGGCQER